MMANPDALVLRCRQRSRRAAPCRRACRRLPLVEGCCSRLPFPASPPHPPLQAPTPTREQKRHTVLSREHHPARASLTRHCQAGQERRVPWEAQRRWRTRGQVQRQREDQVY